MDFIEVISETDGVELLLNLDNVICLQRGIQNKNLTYAYTTERNTPLILRHKLENIKRIIDYQTIVED